MVEGARSLPVAALAFAAAAALAWWLTPVVARLLGARGLLVENYAGRRLPCGVGLVFLGASLPVYGILMFWSPALREEVPALLAAGAVMAAAGLLDDLPAREPKGVRGHLAALQSGVVTSGVAKAAAGLLAGLVAAAALPGPGGGGWRAAEALVTTLLVSLAANAVNALDLRPGRAGKAFLLAALVEVAATGGALHLAPLAGAGAGYLRYDLRGLAMMGDAGANLLGAALGVALARDLSLPGEAAVVAILAAFHLLVERRSLSALIESSPVLKKVDGWGRPGEG